MPQANLEVSSVDGMDFGHSMLLGFTMLFLRVSVEVSLIDGIGLGRSVLLGFTVQPLYISLLVSLVDQIDLRHAVLLKFTVLSLRVSIVVAPVNGIVLGHAVMLWLAVLFSPIVVVNLAPHGCFGLISHSAICGILSQIRCGPSLLMSSDGSLLLSRWGDLLSSKDLLNDGCPIGVVVSFPLHHPATEDDTAGRLPQLFQGVLALALLLSTTGVDFVIGLLGLSRISRQLSFH